MSSSKATDFPLLPEVYREGLRYGIISKEEVTAWADSIIATENEPDYFFIELSLAGDSNAQMEVLNNVVIGLKLAIVQRIMIGLAYQKVIEQTISRKLFTDVCRQVALSRALYPVEDFELFEFEFYDEILFMADPNDFWEEKMAYVSRYAAFTLDNYAQWTTINSRLEVILNKEQAAIDEAEKARQRRKRRKRIKRLWLYILMAVLTAMALALIILNYAAYVGKTLSSKFEVDLYQFGICLLIFAVPYLMLRVVYRLWKMAKKF